MWLTCLSPPVCRTAGSTDAVCGSVGTADPVTAALLIVMGTYPVPVRCKPVTLQPVLSYHCVLLTLLMFFLPVSFTSTASMNGVPMLACCWRTLTSSPACRGNPTFLCFHCPVLEMECEGNELNAADYSHCEYLEWRFIKLVGIWSFQCRSEMLLTYQ